MIQTKLAALNHFSSFNQSNRIKNIIDHCKQVMNIQEKDAIHSIYTFVYINFVIIVVADNDCVIVNQLARFKNGFGTPHPIS